MACGVGALLGGEVRVGEQRRHAEDAVHRRADLVAHGRQEARLGAVGGFRLLARLPQLGLGAPPLGDVAAGALHLGDGGIAGRTACSSHSNQRGPARGLDLLNVALLAQLGAGRQGRTLVAGEHAGAEGAPQHGARSSSNIRQKAWLTKVRRP